MKLPIAAITLCLSLGSVARAQDSADDPRIVQARKACLTGDVQQGIRVLADLYLATDDPIWIFNQGRCYQQNNQPSNALARFKEFLRKSRGGPDDDDVKDANKYIREIEAELQQPSGSAEGRPAGEGKSTGASSGASEPQSVSASTGPGSNNGADGALTAASEQGMSKPPVYKRWWFWSGVVAAVTAGTITAILLSRGSGSNACNGLGPCLEYR